MSRPLIVVSSVCEFQLRTLPESQLAKNSYHHPEHFCSLVGVLTVAEPWHKRMFESCQADERISDNSPIDYGDGSAQGYLSVGPSRTYLSLSRIHNTCKFALCSVFHTQRPKSLQIVSVRISVWIAEQHLEHFVARAHSRFSIDVRIAVEIFGNFIYDFEFFFFSCVWLFEQIK